MEFYVTSYVTTIMATLLTNLYKEASDAYGAGMVIGQDEVMCTSCSCGLDEPQWWSDVHGQMYII